MHRIDSFGATQDNMFTEGNPVVPIPPTQVSADWLNAVQEEISHVVEASGVTLDKQDNSQLLAAVNTLIQAGILAPGAPGTWLQTDASGNIVWAPLPSQYEVGQYYPFQDEMSRPGMVELLGRVVEDVSNYPEMIAYLQSSWGQARLVTQAEYDARHIAFWHTLADGSHVSWNGEGGVNVFVWDQQADTLLVPDLTDMYEKQIGGDAPGVGDVHGDATRPVVGAASFGSGSVGVVRGASGALGLSTATSLIFSTANAQSVNAYMGLDLNVSRVAPVASQVQPRAWGALYCVYLGLPIS